MTEIEKSKAESWENMTLANNFLFCKIMSSDKDLCKELIELLLNVKIDRLEVPQSEKTLQESFDSKSVRFDVYANNETQVFDLEMQTTNRKNLPKRARYYQSAIDMGNLDEGMNYSRLKDSYVIFICLDDIFGSGLPVYHFENLCLNGKEAIKLNDRAFKVFFNASQCDKMENKKKRNFFKFLKGEETDDDFTARLREKVVTARKNKEWRRQYLMWSHAFDEEFEEARESGFATGRSEGFAEGERNARISAAENLLRMNICSPEQIAEAEQLPIGEVLAIKDRLLVSAN